MSRFGKWLGRQREPSVPLEHLAVTPGRPVADKDLPRAAVVVLNLNGRHHLDDCFRSLAEIDYPRDRLEWILVDNGSDDGSVEEMRAKHPAVRLVENEKNLGFSVGCNQGARAARDPGVLAFLNNDVRVEKAWLKELAAPIVRRECQATTSKMLSWDGKTVDSAGGGMSFAGFGLQYGYLEDPGPAFDFPRKTLFACGGSMAIDARVFEEVGGFDEEFFAYYEDVDLGWRMWVQGHECRYVPTSVCYHHHSSTSRNLPKEMLRLLQVRNPLLACVKNYDDRHLALVLGPAFALALHRVRLNMELDDDSMFRIESAARENLGGPRSLLERARRKLDDKIPIKRTAVAHVIGIDDLLGDWGHWMSRRAEVQGRRRRMDDDFLELLLKPRWCIEPNEATRRLQEGLMELSGVDAVFPPDSIPEPKW